MEVPGICIALALRTVAELSDELGYEPYEASGRNSGNSRNGHYPKKVRTSDGDVEIQVPRDRNGEFRTLNLGSADLKALLRKSEAALRQALEPLSLDDLEVERLHPARQSMVSIGWAVTHALEHTAGHTGEIQLARHIWLKGNPPE